MLTSSSKSDRGIFFLVTHYKWVTRKKTSALRFTHKALHTWRTENFKFLFLPYYKHGICVVFSRYAFQNKNFQNVFPVFQVAVVGKEESGIYTILDSIFRIREISEEQIFIDNIDISNIGLHDLRSRLSFLPQVFFFLITKLSVFPHTFQFSKTLLILMFK